jgi:hypothetical protein
MALAREMPQRGSTATSGNSLQSFRLVRAGELRWLVDLPGKHPVWKELALLLKVLGFLSRTQASGGQRAGSVAH